MPPSAGVIGWPVAHSKSPLIHRFWLAKLGIDGDYGRFAVAPERLGEAIRALPALGLRGVNVTVPHKVAVMAYLDHFDDLAAEIGAVNTVVVEDGRLVGFNTDGDGFHSALKSWRAEVEAANAGSHVHLIGTGGAAQAIAHGWGSEITVYGRDLAKAERLAVASGSAGDAVHFASLDDLQRPSSDNAPSPSDPAPNNRPARYLVVNATTLGMLGQPPLHIDLDRYPEDTMVYDIVYSPLETPLLAAARARGLRTIDGLSMLIGQASAAFELFFGAPAPREYDAELRTLLTA
nr:shikimate dehydrogenase [Polymorphobacter sp.]